VSEARDPLDYPYETATVHFKGASYTFRELTLGENDSCRELATDPEGNIDGRSMMRAMVIESAVAPELDSDKLLKTPQRLYARFVDTVNRLNDPDSLDEKDEDPGNG
jgi:hypothetical protein